jgi:hypothetical protein
VAGCARSTLRRGSGASAAECVTRQSPIIILTSRLAAMELLPETLGALEVAYIIETAGDAATGDDDKRLSVRRSVVNRRSGVDTRSEEDAD